MENSKEKLNGNVDFNIKHFLLERRKFFFYNQRFSENMTLSWNKMFINDFVQISQIQLNFVLSLKSVESLIQNMYVVRKNVF